MHSTRPLWQLEERARNHLKLVSNTILGIMRPGCLILTATILRSSIKASRRSSRQRRKHHSGMDRDRQRTRPPLPRPARPPGLRLKLPTVFSSFPTFQRSNAPVCLEPYRAPGGIVETCGLACHDEVVRSVAGRVRSYRSDQEPLLIIRSVVGTQPVTNG